MIDTLLSERHGSILVLTLNKPQKLNAIDADMLVELASQIEAADADDTIAVTVIRGTGRSFSTGFDMSAGGSAQAAGPRLRANLEHFLSIWRARKLVVAAVDGYALGAGLILASLCDLTFASERATFGEPEIRYWNPASITILPWIVGVRRAKQLLFFGRSLDARTALDWGLVNDVLPEADFFDAVLEAVRPLTHLHPDSVAALKRSINGGLDVAGFVDALRAGVDTIAPLYEPDAPARLAARAEVDRVGFKAYIRNRDLLLGN